MLELSEPLTKMFPEEAAFDRILALDGQVYRQVKGRRTLRFEADGRGYFLKLHTGVGWGEIFKNLVHLRLPVISANNERHAIRKFQELGVETMKIAGWGQRGVNPAVRQSFLITEELENTVSLEDFCRGWAASPPPYALRRALVIKLARITRTLHTNGVNHRDFYLCHFLLQLPLPAVVGSPDDLPVFLIDLHRVQLRSATPQRWAVKDVAGLYFSSLDIGLTRRDVLRFMRCYSGRNLRATLDAQGAFWKKVRRRAVQLYRRDFRRDPVLPV